jgi:hypothetical protein
MRTDRYISHLSPSLAIGWLTFLFLLFPLAAIGEHPMLAYIMESGDSRMLSSWATRYEYGASVPQNIDLAIELYCKAAQAGDSEAQYHLGSIYAEGRAGHINQVLAAAWLNLAAEQGHAAAKAQLTKLGAYGIPIQTQAECIASKDLIAQELPKPPPVRTAKFRGSSHPNYVKIKRLVKKLAPQYELNPDLVLAVIAAESNFNPRAMSHKNAKGLMQLIPETAARFGVRNIWDPEQNLRGGMAYLRWLLGYFDGKLHLALAAYNAGEKAVDRYGGIPPYPETQNYVRLITKSLNLEQNI